MSESASSLPSAETSVIIFIYPDASDSMQRKYPPKERLLSSVGLVAPDQGLDSARSSE